MPVVPLAEDFLQRILAADESIITVPLSGGGTAQGRVTSLQRDGNGPLLVQGVVTHPEAGRFMFQRQTAAGKAGSLAGFIHYDNSDIAYQVRPLGANGQPVLVKTTVDEVVCRAYATPPDAVPQDPQEIPPTHPTDYPIPPDENGIMQLQSLPGATAVIYLDFDGEERDFASWGYINALPSGATNTRIFEIWKGVCEDYQPFNINITTVRGAYDAAPPGRRIQIIITPTTTASPGAGGVAYVGSFNWTSDMVCWAFWASYSTGKNMVEIISHEVGHTLCLAHDGRTTPAEGYYAGHDGWAPIMGVGYYQTLTQWSKGEYPNANNTEDDLNIIVSNNNAVAYRADDHGATFATATCLEITAAGTVSNEGIIETTADEDSFRFATSGGMLTLDINNVAFNPNLDLKAEILDSSGQVIATHDPADSLDAFFSGLDLPAGDYFLRVSGTGNGDLTTGCPDYASLGAYTITGTVNGGVPADLFNLAENSANGTVLGTVASRTSHGAGVLAFAISSGNTGGTFAINPATGALTVANNTLLDFETLSTRWDDPATFELFVAITDSLGTAEESIRTVVTVSDVKEALWAANQSLTVREGAGNGRRVGQMVFTAPNSGQAVASYAITAGNKTGIFAIHSLSGEITVANSGGLVGGTRHDLTITAADNGSPAQTATATATIQVLGLDEQLHAWWKLDESSGATVLDSSGNARHATLYGGASWVARSGANQMLQLNGTNARFDYLGHSALSGGTSFSVAAWVKVPVTHAADGVLIQQRGDSPSGYIGQYRVCVKANGKVNFILYGKDENNANAAFQFNITSTNAIKDGAWHHVACIRDGITGQVFIDGVQRASGSGTIRWLDPALPVAVGCDIRYYNAYLDASVDDVRIYAEALGSQQLVKIARTPKVAITNPVTASAAIPLGVGLMLQAAASDPVGPVPALVWSQVSGPGVVTFGTPSAAETTALFALPGSYILRVTASNGASTATAELTVSVGGTASSPFDGSITSNMGPWVNAGVDSPAVAGIPTDLSGNATDDGLPNPSAATSVSWSVVSGPGSVTFGNPNQAATTATCDAAGTYVLRLIADDGEIKTFDDTTLVLGARLTPFQTWQRDEFGPQADNPLLAGDMADPDGDGLSNLLEFALGTKPNQAGATTIVHDLESIDGTHYLRLTISRNPAATDLTFTVQTTTDLSDPNAWTDADTVIEEKTPKLVVRDKLAGPRRFIRLRVTR
jgi:hypothetical protein